MVEAAIVARLNRTPRAEADGRVERLRAFVEQVERPDVERPAGQINPRWRGGLDMHGEIIAAMRVHNGQHCDGIGRPATDSVPSMEALWQRAQKS